MLADFILGDFFRMFTYVIVIVFLLIALLYSRVFKHLVEENQDKILQERFDLKIASFFAFSFVLL